MPSVNFKLESSCSELVSKINTITLINYKCVEGITLNIIHEYDRNTVVHDILEFLRKLLFGNTISAWYRIGS